MTEMKETKDIQILDEFRVLLKDKHVAISHFCNGYRLAVNRFRNILGGKTAIGADELNAVMDWMGGNKPEQTEINPTDDGFGSFEALYISDSEEYIRPKTDMTMNEILKLADSIDNKGAEFVRYVFDNKKEISTAIVQSDDDDGVWEFLDFFVQSKDIHLIGHIFLHNTMFGSRHQYLGLVSVDHKDKILLTQMVGDFNNQHGD